jgi:hypothetical protein
VPAPDPVLFLASSLPASAGVLAYGPAPGIELIPYFLGLVAWAGLSVVAVLLSPITALLRRLRRGRGTPPPEPKSEPQTAPEPESPGEGNHDRA